jgi:hypothetical protein
MLTRYRKEVAMGTDRTIYEDRVLKLADLVARNTNRIENITFVNCQLYGPAVVFPDSATSFNNPMFDAPGLDPIIWAIPSDQMKIGGINAINCIFESCRFSMIGLAMTPEQAEEMHGKAA